WFRTHKPLVAAHLPRFDFSPVDSPYQTVMLLTARNATRRKYLEALKEAKAFLVTLRALILTGPLTPPSGASTPEPSPNFAPLVSDINMQAILTRRWEEVQKCMNSKANLAATVMMGGLLESLLLARINGSPAKAAVFTSSAAPKDKAG